jgi:hypothetical protein
MVRIGLDRFLLASDYNAGLDLRPYFADQRMALGLSESDWDRLAGNIAPYMALASAGQCLSSLSGTWLATSTLRAQPIRARRVCGMLVVKSLDGTCGNAQGMRPRKAVVAKAVTQ